jgi:hypothetical protein
MRFSRVSMWSPPKKKARRRVTPGWVKASFTFQVSAAQWMFRKRQGRLFGLELGDFRFPIYFLNQILHLSLGEFRPIFSSIASTRERRSTWEQVHKKTNFFENPWSPTYGWLLSTGEFSYARQAISASTRLRY